MTPVPKFHFFVDSVRFETDQASLTGAQIRAFIPGTPPAYQLFLEEPGDHPDRQISDAEAVSLEQHAEGIRKFYLVPPATFGT
jgi:hypothetical protein